MIPPTSSIGRLTGEPFARNPIEFEVRHPPEQLWQQPQRMSRTPGPTPYGDGYGLGRLTTLSLGRGMPAPQVRLADTRAQMRIENLVSSKIYGVDVTGLSTLKLPSPARYGGDDDPEIFNNWLLDVLRYMRAHRLVNEVNGVFHHPKCSEASVHRM